MQEDYFAQKQKRWDDYFHKLCEAVASKSPCLSRQIGVVIVRDNSIISTGFNGPARGYPHCERTALPRRNMEQDKKEYGCPRRASGFKSGEGLEHCPAAHAETNAIANAARLGVSVLGASLYMNSVIPCKFCAVSIVNAGISEVVVDDLYEYHELSKEILIQGKVTIRRFRQ
ncbi:MAG: dCMP deaminase family protein [Gammaproteobacteria bacterium]|nr:dCMP deaminase family protein [Gammaproteobacteria bacterium]